LSNFLFWDEVLKRAVARRALKLAKLDRRALEFNHDVLQAHGDAFVLQLDPALSDLAEAIERSDNRARLVGVGASAAPADRTGAPRDRLGSALQPVDIEALAVRTAWARD
jgi:hypothetical protein